MKKGDWQLLGLGVSVAQWKLADEHHKGNHTEANKLCLLCLWALLKLWLDN